MHTDSREKPRAGQTVAEISWLMDLWGNKNELLPSDVPVYSHQKVWWKCSEGLPGHEWLAQVANFANSNLSCAYCNNRILLKGYNDLVTCFPKTSESWSSRNVLSADQVKIGTKTKFWWRCALGHEWKTTIGHRTDRGQDCPYCSSVKVLSGFNDFATVHPDKVHLWSKRNALGPNEIAARTKKKFWWTCEIGHEWEASVGKIALGRGCHYCKNRKLLKGFNDLETVSPEVAKEWSTKNAKPASEVLAFTQSSGWWICKCGYEWFARISSRVSPGYGCSRCSSKVSNLEKDVLKFIKSIVASEILLNVRHGRSNPEIDILLPNEGIAIEVNGEYWHSNAHRLAIGASTAEEYHESKKAFCSSLGYTIAFVWEDDWKNDGDATRRELTELLRCGKVSERFLRLSSRRDEI